MAHATALVERTGRLILLARMDNETAASALAGFSATLNSIAAPLRQTFTYDQGKEMSRHQPRLLLNPILPFIESSVELHP